MMTNNNNSLVRNKSAVSGFVDGKFKFKLILFFLNRTGMKRLKIGEISYDQLQKSYNIAQIAHLKVEGFGSLLFIRRQITAKFRVVPNHQIKILALVI